MKHVLLFSLSLIMFGFARCGSPASSNPDDYIGEYVFMPANSSPGQFASFVILKPDHEAVQIRFDKSSGQIHTNREKWYLSRGTGQNLVIGQFSCSVEGSGANIKLGINDDLGQYYEKVR